MTHLEPDRPSLPLRVAAEWWVRLRGRDVPAETSAEWLAWSAADSKNTEAFERLRELGEQLEAIDSNSRRAFVAEFAGKPRHHRARRLLAVAASLLVIVAVGGLTAHRLQNSHSQPESQTFSTPIAVNRSVALVDGSRVTLGGASAVTAQFGNGMRRIDLQEGEAYFQVAHDKSRPFLVSAGELRVRAVGTAFDVRRTGGRVMVAVTEGVVQITQEDAPSSTVSPGALVAVAGQQVTYDAAQHRLAVSAIDVSQVLGWEEGRLQFVDEPLQVVVANINRYAHKTVRITDDSVGALSFTGTVTPAGLGNWAAALPHVFPVQVRVTDSSIVIAPRNQARVPH